MAIDCNKCSAEKYCGTVVSCIRLCSTIHPEWWDKKEKTTTTSPDEEQYYKEMEAVFG